MLCEDRYRISSQSSEPSMQSQRTAPRKDTTQLGWKSKWK